MERGLLLVPTTHSLAHIVHINHEPMRLASFLAHLRDVVYTARGTICTTFSCPHVRQCVVASDWSDPRHPARGFDSRRITHRERLVHNVVHPFVSRSRSRDLDALFDTIRAAEEIGVDWRFDLRFLHQCEAASEQQEIVCHQMCSECARFAAEGRARGVYLY